MIQFEGRAERRGDWSASSTCCRLFLYGIFINVLHSSVYYFQFPFLVNV